LHFPWRAASGRARLLRDFFHWLHLLPGRKNPLLRQWGVAATDRFQRSSTQQLLGGSQMARM